MERLGLGPDACLARNPRLVYGRMTGWGQDGPLAAARRPRHQLHRAHRRAARDRPRRRGAGAAAQPGRRLRRRRRASSPSACSPRCSRRARSGKGQVVDAAIFDGAPAADGHVRTALTPAAPGSTQRGTNLLDGGAPWYDIYETARRPARRGRRDRGRSSTPSCCAALGLDAASRCRRSTTAPAGRRCAPRFAARFRTSTRDEWCRRVRGHRRLLRAGAVAGRGPRHPHHVARGTFVARPARRSRRRRRASSARRAALPTPLRPPPEPSPAWPCGRARLAAVASSAPRLLEHHRLVPVQQHAVLDVPAHRARQHHALDVAADGGEVLGLTARGPRARRPAR